MHITELASSEGVDHVGYRQASNVPDPRKSFQEHWTFQIGGLAKNELEIIHDYNLPSCFSIRRYLPNLSWGEYLGGWGLDALSLQTGQVRLRVYLLQALQRLSFFNAVPHLEDRENSKWWSCSLRKDSAALTLFCMMFSAVL